MPRVFLNSDDAAFHEALSNFFLPEEGFEVCGEARDSIETIEKAADLLPDLVILETKSSSPDDLQIAEALKLSMPSVPVFLVAEEHDMRYEKNALSHGIDAVFKKDQDLTALLLNARAVCGLD